MGNVKKAVPFSKRRFEYLLNRRGQSKNQFAKRMFPNTKQPLRKLLKYLASEELPPEILSRFASAFNCYPGYLDGSVSITREYLQKQFGDEYLERWVHDEDFDPDGYYTGFFTEIGDNIPVAEERAITFLNDYLYSYETKVTKYGMDFSAMSFDFHDLDQQALYDLIGDIIDMVENRILNPSSQEWIDFVKTTKRKHRMKGESTDDKKETEEE